MPERGPHIVIAGLMGVGKTTTARAVADELGWPMRDSDEDIEARYRHTGAELAEHVGVDELHRYEAEVLADALAAEAPSVIAAAGWVIEDERSRELMMSRANVAVLEIAVGDLMDRIATGAHRRHMSEADLRAAAVNRAPLFAEVATWRLDARGSTNDLVKVIVNDARVRNVMS